MKKKRIEKLEGYEQLLADVRAILDKGLGRVYQAVDNIRVQTYWQVGDRIITEELKHKQRADYGKRVAERLATDLGFSRRAIFEMIQFSRTYPIVRPVAAQLSWTHFTTLIRIKDETERKFYEVQAIKNGWSRRELQKRIKQREYEKAKKAGKVELTLPKLLPEPVEAFKGIYDFDFAELEAGHTEKELEKALVDNIRETLLELGHGFFFGGQQFKIGIAGQFHKIDLLFFHRRFKE